ncbi:retrotransposon protein, putative, ty1-copia subclass [Tanacetum coccineum]
MIGMIWIEIRWTATQCGLLMHFKKDSRQLGESVFVDEAREEILHMEGYCIQNKNKNTSWIRVGFLYGSQIPEENMGYEMNAPGKSVDSFEEGEIIGESDDGCVKDCMGKKLDDDVEKDIEDCSNNVTEKCGVVNNNMSNNVEGEILEDHFDGDRGNDTIEDKCPIWGCDIEHINKKCIEKLQHDRLLKSIEDDSFDKCVSCMSGKITRKPFPHQTERTKDLLGLIHRFSTKKVENTPYEVWHGQALKLSYLKVWGYEALVKRDTLIKHDKLKPRSNNLLMQEASRSLVNLEEIQVEDTHPSKNTSEHHDEDEQEIVELESDVIPIRRSTRTRHAPDRMCLYVDAEEHKLGDHNEPTNYKAALSDSKYDKWLEAMNVEMQSMKDNHIWDLDHLPPKAKTVGSKWQLKKKTDMDGNVHTDKPRLVANGFTQTYRVDYEETFSPVADIRAIRILLAIIAYYDYEIWQMDVKTAFLNGHLTEEVYMVQPKGFVNPKYPYRACKIQRFNMENPKRESIPMQEKPILSKAQGASTHSEVKRMQRVLYASAIGSIISELLATLMLDIVDDSKPQTGYAFILNGGVVDCKSAKQSTTETSSTEVEYMASLEASKEAVWISKFIYGLGVVRLSNQISLSTRSD